MIRKQLLHEGQFAAEVEIELIPDDGAWGPYVGPDDVMKLDRVRRALQDGDVEAASRDARVFRLLPVSA